MNNSRAKANEGQRRWRAKNPERWREIRQRYREKNAARIREQRQAREAANLEKERERKRRWREANLNGIREAARRRREKQRELDMQSGVLKRPVGRPRKFEAGSRQIVLRVSSPLFEAVESYRMSRGLRDVSTAVREMLKPNSQEVRMGLMRFGNFAVESERVYGLRAAAVAAGKAGMVPCELEVFADVPRAADDPTVRLTGPEAGLLWKFACEPRPPRPWRLTKIGDDADGLMIDLSRVCMAGAVKGVMVVSFALADGRGASLPLSARQADAFFACIAAG